MLRMIARWLAWLLVHQRHRGCVADRPILSLTGGHDLRVVQLDLGPIATPLAPPAATPPRRPVLRTAASKRLIAGHIARRTVLEALGLLALLDRACAEPARPMPAPVCHRGLLGRLVNG